MKLRFKNILLLAVALLMTTTACDEGFGELNTNPNAANEINPKFQFTFIQLRTSGERYENWRASLIYSSMMMQHMAALCSYWTGDKYTYNAGYASSLFDRQYEQAVRDMQDLIVTLESGEAGDQTMLGMARIWRVVIFHRLTDLYGDVPYFEAGKGFLEGVDRPTFDAQEAIYMDMLNELEQAVAQLGEGGFEEADLIYGGNVDQWRRFGNSMMLRLGMRLSEVNASEAQKWVEKAIQGGTLQPGDDAFIEHTNGPEGINMNGIGEVLDLANGSAGENCPRISETFINWMKDHNDPRLTVIASPAVNTGEFTGLPNGLDNTTILDNPTGTDIEDFSRVNQAIVRVSSPMMFMTVAEAELLQAEAAVRGWGASDAAGHYANGVRAAMKRWEVYDASLAISDADIDAYLAANPFDSGDAMRQIGEQYWAATFLNEYETFANWRRTGYPELTPVNYPGNVTGGTIPVRLVLPQGELSVNPNMQAALNNQSLGTDFATHMTIPVWWDR
ncbi:SusD/RagB family nutrient-binding outer membrane lipoprotein [Phaeodactylibacter luteus]|uniref:SusD/RagB family nutrient-binding outer membrane lipoprotein n=1 Tax=Phaeodactylibacter luteus TaxID=1564516 RepID=A0A5C6RJA3_9BACT|nr:SusD/RagB family nutrient-binding outer membrane lipoprotein [Phaeodactylibacter luteus]TXB62049.1 SusD/RagB family nutrient-binding outer membrane lipoprotein [Phaeodactylibacter luteus]